MRGVGEGSDCESELSDKDLLTLRNEIFELIGVKVQITTTVA